MDQQMSLFDMIPEEMDVASSGTLNVVKAEFQEAIKLNWKELFDGFDELYGITFSSGIQFMEKVFDKFEHIEMIFGCEGVLSNEVAAIISMQIKTVEEIVKSKCVKRIAERIEDGSVELRVSRDTRSHEKIFILKAHDGRVRVITGSANMSASAFLGMQREDIICFDNQEAFDYYKDLFENFKDKCSDSVSQKVIEALVVDPDYVRDNVQEVPIINTIKDKKMVILEPSEYSEEVEIIADLKNLENEIKPLLPRINLESNKTILTGDVTRSFKRKYDENASVKKVKQKKLPKLHIDYEAHKVDLNNNEFNLNPSREDVRRDIECLLSLIDNLEAFHGDYMKSQRDYYKFFNWYFASPLMPYLRYVGTKNNYDVIPFPVCGILYGDSNGGKTTFVKLFSKMMSGTKIPVNSSGDFTSTNISNLKRACEGLPLAIDDLAKAQYDTHFEKIIKDDGWGIKEHFVNYPAVVISTNKLPSLKPDISKRVVTCRIDIRIDKEKGARNSKRINESMKQAGNALFCEYMRRMFDVVEKMTDSMRDGEENYFPDIFAESSSVLKSIISESLETVPDYVTELTYSDYFGDLAIGKHAIMQIKTAWQTEPKLFKADKKKNTLVYTYPENGRLYELKHLQDELPPSLEAGVTARSLVMKLDVAAEIFGESFRKGLFG